MSCSRHCPKLLNPPVPLLPRTLCVLSLAARLWPLHAPQKPFPKVISAHLSQSRNTSPSPSHCLIGVWPQPPPCTSDPTHLEVLLSECSFSFSIFLRVLLLFSCLLNLCSPWPFPEPCFFSIPIPWLQGLHPPSSCPLLSPVLSLWP